MQPFCDLSSLTYPQHRLLIHHVVSQRGLRTVAVEVESVAGGEVPQLRRGGQKTGVGPA